MSEPETQIGTKSIVLERDLAHPPEKVWRAITQPHLIAEWMKMQGDFAPEVGHAFSYANDWGSVRGEVLLAEAPRRLSYSWGDGDLESVVTFTLEPVGAGTRLRLEQVGFRSDQPRYYHGARMGWPQHLERLATVLEGDWA